MKISAAQTRNFPNGSEMMIFARMQKAQTETEQFYCCVARMMRLSNRARFLRQIKKKFYFKNHRLAGYFFLLLIGLWLSIQEKSQAGTKNKHVNIVCEREREKSRVEWILFVWRFLFISVVSRDRKTLTKFSLLLAKVFIICVMFICVLFDFYFLSKYWTWHSVLWVSFYSFVHSFSFLTNHVLTNKRHF